MAVTETVPHSEPNYHMTLSIKDVPTPDIKSIQGNGAKVEGDWVKGS